MNLIEARRNKGLSRAQAAQEIRIARATLIAAEEGRSIHEASAKRIADFYGCRVTDIWPVEDPNGNDASVAA